MEHRNDGPSEEQLLQVANMAFGVIASFRKKSPLEELRENMDWLEHALGSAFTGGDPFVRCESTEAKQP
jgi:hypothetical protein